MKEPETIPEKPKIKPDLVVAVVIIFVAGLALCGVGKFCLDDPKSPRIAGYGILLVGLGMIAAAIGIPVKAITGRKVKLKCPKCGSSNIGPLSEKERGEHGFPSFAIAGYGKCLDCGDAWPVPVAIWLWVVAGLIGLLLTSCFFFGGYGGATLGSFGAIVLFGCAKHFFTSNSPRSTTKPDE